MGAVRESEVLLLHAEICSALADPKRILLLYELAEGPHHVTDLATALGITQPQASRHLKVLRERGLVSAERHGSMVSYSLADGRVIQALDLLRSVLADKLRSQAALVESVTPPTETS
jgi:DNA-binding transcriptional ArsR family regulator